MTLGKTAVKKMKKNYKTFLSVMLIIGILFILIFNFLANKSIDSHLSFHHKKDFTVQHLSKKDYSILYANHQECFEKVKLRNLTKYYIEKNNLQSNWDKNFIKKRVEKHLNHTAKDSFEQFKYTTNGTLLKFKNKIIGHYSCAEESIITDHSIMISNVCLEKSMRGKGLGKKLISNAIEHCSKKDRDLSLLVYKDDDVAINLYKKVGFIKTEPKVETDTNFNFFNKFLMIYKPKTVP